MTTYPIPPFLIVRPAVAFWVEGSPHDQLRCTVSAFHDAVYDDAMCVDTAGSVWTVERARSLDRIGSLWKLFPWKQLTVSLELTPERTTSLGEVVTLLQGVVESDSDFRDHLSISPADLVLQLQAARSFEEVIAIAAKV